MTAPCGGNTFELQFPLMTLAKSGLAKNILSVGIVQIANYVFPIISMPIISRIIGPEKFGVINYAAAVIAYLTLIIGYGFDLTATRKIARDPHNVENRNTVFSEVICARLLLFGVASLAFAAMVGAIPKLQEEPLVALFSYLFCIGSLLTPNWVFQGMQELSKVALLNFLTKLFFTVAILLVVRKQSDYIWQPLIVSAVQILIALVSFTWARRRYQIKLRWVPLRRCLALLYEERTVFLSLVVVSLYTTANTVILGFYQSTEQIGYFTAGQRLIHVAQSVLTMPLAQSLYPVIGKGFSDSFDRGMQMVHKVLPTIFLFTFLSGIIMLFTGPFVLTAFYGRAFSPGIIVFQLLAFIPMLVAVSNVLGIQIMLNLKLDKLFFRITAYGAVLSISLNFLLIRQWGIVGTALTWLLTECFITMAMYYVLRKRNIHPFSLAYFKPSILLANLQPFGRKLFAGKINRS